MADSEQVFDDPIDRFPRHDFRSIDAFIDRRGVDVEWRRGIPCPCKQPDTRQPRIDCDVCASTGFAYPTKLRERLKILVTGRQWNVRTSEGGNLTSGTVNLTFPRGKVPGTGDQVWPENEEHVVMQDVPTRYRPVDVRALAEIAADGARIVRPGPQGDRLLYPDILAIEYVSWYDAEHGRLVELREHLDYSVATRDTHSSVRWHDKGAPPPAGSMVSWRYTAPAVFMLMPSEPRFRQQGNQPLPYSAMGYRLDKWGEKDLR